MTVLEPGAGLPPFRCRLEHAKAAEFAYAIGDELRPLPGGELEAPVGFLFFVTAQDSGEVFRTLGLAWTDVVFAGLSLDYERPVRVGEALEGRTCVTEVKRRGDVVFASLQTRYADETGAEPLVELSTVAVRTPAPAPAPGPPGEPPAGDLLYQLAVSRMAIAWMAVALGDPNPIHVEDEVARRAGFPSAIAHGTFPIGAIGAMLTRAHGAGSVRSLDVRLTGPTYPGDTVTAVGVADRDGGLDVAAYAGQRLLARGCADLVAP